MLTVSPIKSAGGASNYFLSTAQAYYDEGYDASYWMGGLRESLGIDGAVDGQDFSNLLKGVLPDGLQMGRREGSEFKHRPGYELCFSIPKSLSIMALLGKDERIIECTKEAVDRVFKLIESKYAAARVTVNGETKSVLTNKLIAACFFHPTSRNGDPQGHIHALVMNMTQTPDGKIRALTTDRFNDKGLIGAEALFRHNKMLGLMFRNELAYLLKERTDYQIVDDGQDSFKIEGVPDELIKAASSRRQEIEDKISETGFDSAKAKLVANHASRKAKSEMPMSEVLKHWNSLSEKYDFKPENVPGFSKEKVELELKTEINQPLFRITTKIKSFLEQIKTQREPLTHDELATLAVKSAEEACLAKSDSFTVADVLQEATSRVFGEISCVKLSEVVTKRIKSNWLMTAEHEYVTLKSHALDEKISTLLQPEPCKAVMKPYAGRFWQTRTDNFEAGVESLLLNPTRMQCVNGKVDDQNAFRQEWIDAVKSKNYLPVIIAPNRHDADTLKAAHGIPTRTLSGFEYALKRKNFRTVNRPIIWLESSHKMNAKSLATVLEIAQEKKWRVILSGNDESATNVQHKTVFHRAMESLPQVNIGEPHNFSEELMSTIMFAREKAIESRLVRVAQVYSDKLTLKQKVCVFSPLRHRQALNTAIRATLKKNGIIDSRDIKMPLLRPLYHNVANLHKETYDKDTYWLVLSGITGVKNNAWLKVISNDSDKQEVTLEQANGKTKKITWKEAMAKHATIIPYQRKALPIANGDSLRAVRSHDELDIKARDTFRVIAIEEGRVLVERDDNLRTFVLDLNESPILEHNYVHSLSEVDTLTKESDAIILATKNDYTVRSIFEAAKRAGNVTVAAANTIALQASIRTLSPVTPKMIDLSKTPQKDMPYEIVKQAVDILSTEHAAFTSVELMDQMASVQASLGIMSIEDMDKALGKVIESGELLNVNDWHIPAETMQMEQQMLAIYDNGRGACKPLIPTIDKIPPTLSAEQSTLYRKIGGSHDQVLLLQGYAGVGKTYLLKQLADNTTKKVIGVSVTKNVVRSLNEEGIQSYTLAHFLTHKLGEELTENHLVIVDEISMLDNIGAHALLLQTQIKNAQILLTGDIHQCQGMGAGNPAKLLFGYGGRSTLIATDIRRQKPTQLRDAVKACINKDMPQLFLQLSKNIIEVADEVLAADEKITDPNNEAHSNVTASDPNESIKATMSQPDESDQFSKTEDILPSYVNERHKIMAKAWLALPPSERSEVLLPVLSHTGRLGLSEAIRDGLSKEGTLYGEEVIVQTLRPQFRKTARYAAELRDNDILKVIKPIDKQVKLGHSYQVISTRTADNSIEVKNLTESHEAALRIHLPGLKAKDDPFSVFRFAPIQLRAGDKLRLTDNHRVWGLSKNERLDVTSIDSKQIHVRLENGRLESIPRDEHSLNFIDYNYAFTVYSVQGMTNKKIMSDFPSYNQNSDHIHFLVSLSRAVEGALIFTDESKKLAKSIAQPPNERRIALDCFAKTKALVTPKLKLESPVYTAKQDKSSTRSAPQNSNEILRQNMKKNVKQTDKTIFPTYDLDRIQDALLHDTSWIHTYSDKPVKQSGRGIKIGHGVGSLKVTIHGSNAGTWYDFTEQKGGGLINLLAHFHGKTFKQILPLAGHITNVHPTNEPLDMVRTKPKAIQKKEPALDKEAQERFDKAVNFVKESVPLKGTLAETYLRQHRGITGALPDSLTYHPAVNFYEKGKAYPALIGAVHHQDGSLSRAQFCFLDPKTGSKVARNLSRLTIGKGDAHGLTLTHNPSSKTVIMAEGIETGMSLLDAHPEHTVMVGFGQHFSRIELPKHIENVILAADNDGIETYKRSGYHALINKMQEENRDIQVAIPGNKGEDFNDVLKNEGKGSVRDSVQHAIGHATYTQLSVLHEHSVDPEVKKAEPSKVPTHSQAPISAPKPSIKHDFEIEI